MAVLSDTGIRMGSSAVEEDSSFQIKKSIKFSDINNTDTYLQNSTPRFGDRRTFTVSMWYKRTRDHQDNDRLFTTHNASTGKGFTINHDTSGELIVYDYNGSSYHLKLETRRQMHDYSAWYHICIIVDMNNSIESERCRMYINGLRELDFKGGSSETYPAQGTELHINMDTADYPPTIGRSGQSDSGYFAGYVAHPQFISGLALHPASFGEFDASGTWNPRELTFPTPNNDASNPTWSNYYDSNNNTPQNGTNAFDGKLTTYTGASATHNCGWNPPETIEAKCEIRLYMEIAGSGNGTTAKCNNVERWHDWVAHLGRNTKGWWTVPERKLIKNVGGGWNDAINFAYNGNDDVRIYAVEVDGVILKDGHTDTLTGRNNPNHGQVYGNISHLVAGSSSNPTDADKAFDGSVTTHAHGLSTSWFQLTPTNPISFNDTVEVWIRGRDDSNANVAYTFNPSSIAYSSATPSWTTANKGTWTTIATGGGTFTKLGVKNVDSSTQGIQLHAVRVDGHILIDKSRDTSFHLKFEDTSTNAALGKNSFNKAIASATGGLPIYNTTGDQGETKGSGYRTDSSAGTTDGTGLVFALPGDALTDEHDHINTGSSAVALSAQGNVAVTTNHSRFYGSSIYFPGTDGSDHFIKSTSSNSDFTFGTGTFTIEFWIKKNASQNRNILQMHSAEGIANNYTGGFVLDVDGNEKVQVWMGKDGGGTENIDSHNGAITIGKWHHVVFTRTSGTVYKWYVDGTCIETHTMSSTEDLNSTYIVIGGGWTNSYNLDGWLQDFRIYKGVVKYTTNFTPPTRNDFTPYNLNHTNSYWGATYGLSSFFTLSGGALNSYTNLFDGLLTTTTWNNSANHSWTWTPTTKPTCETKFRYHVGSFAANANHEVQVQFSDGSNTTNVTDSSPGSGWNTITHPGGAYDRVNWIKVTKGSGGYVDVSAIELDDTILSETQFTPNNVVNDTPTNSGTDGGAGGQITGNYCTYNGWDNTNRIRLFEGGLAVRTNGSSYGFVQGTIGMPAGGKFYWEVTIPNHSATAGECYAGIGNRWEGQGDQHLSDYAVQLKTAGDPYFYTNGNTSNQSIGAWAPGEILGLAFDVDAGTLKYYRNNTLKYTHTGISTSITWHPAFNIGTGASTDIDVYTNFGATPFKYTAPSGYKCLCTQNLPDLFADDEDRVNDPSQYFNISLWNGLDIDGMPIPNWNFKPGFLWMKSRNTAISNILQDQLRGVGSTLDSDNNDPESTGTGYVESFENDGFKLEGSGGGNTSGRTYVGWGWYAGPSAKTASTDGTITPSAQWFDTAAGFGMCKYTGTGADATIGHGLGVPPDLILFKDLDTAAASTTRWIVMHSSLANNKFMYLNQNNAAGSDGGIFFNETSPTNTVFSIGTEQNVNKNGSNMFAYYWAGKPGFSAFGRYTGNTSTEFIAQYPFIYTGFRPRWLMYKCDSAAKSWFIHDTTRDPANIESDTTDDRYLQPNEAGTEGENIGGNIYLLSNGFIMGTNNADQNTSSQTFVWAAFAEHPFKTARGR